MIDLTLIRNLINRLSPNEDRQRPALVRPVTRRAPRPKPAFVNVVPYSYNESEIFSIELRTSETIFKVGDVIQARTMNNPVTINSFQYDDDVLTFTYTDSLGRICCNSVDSHSPWFQLQNPEKLKQIEYNFVDLSDSNIEWKCYVQRKRNNNIIYNIVIENITENILDTLNMILSAHDRMCASNFNSNDCNHTISLNGKLDVSLWYFE